jgi:hypothetical protein
MTPKEKAIDLLDKYYYDTDLLYEYLTWIQAKKCALIVVDEILEFIEDERQGFNWKTYYQKVKQEIEKL